LDQRIADAFAPKSGGPPTGGADPFVESVPLFGWKVHAPRALTAALVADVAGREGINEATAARALRRVAPFGIFVDLFAMRPERSTVGSNAQWVLAHHGARATWPREVWPAAGSCNALGSAAAPLGFGPPQTTTLQEYLTSVNAPARIPPVTDREGPKFVRLPDSLPIPVEPVAYLDAAFPGWAESCVLPRSVHGRCRDADTVWPTKSCHSLFRME
jgi:hypothetical protein